MRDDCESPSKIVHTGPLCFTGLYDVEKMKDRYYCFIEPNKLRYIDMHHGP